MSLLDEIAAKLEVMPQEDKQVLIEKLAPMRAKMRFLPLPGPQTEAYLSDADVLLYGGQAGSGKSYLLTGLASQEHVRGIIFRRESAQTDGLEEAGKAIIGETARFNGTEKEWTWPNGRSLKLAGMQQPGDWNKHAGRERDFFGFDEAGEFMREQVSSLLAWNRGPEGQRCRVVLASNPPRSADGYWMIEWFAPWLDHGHPNPALPGELRWAVMIKGEPIWVDGPDEVFMEGELRRPISFTMIPAALSDNPYRDTPEYRARLQSLPEPLRSQLLYGDFTAGGEDDQWQVLPTEWIKEAQRRWTKTAPLNVPMCAIGCDVAQGGADQSVLAIRYDGWFAPLIVEPGVKTPLGSDVAGMILAKRRDNAMVIIDVGGGWGADAYGHLRANEIDAVPYMGVKPSVQRTEGNQLKFSNIRTQAIWRFREALNPDQQGGSPIMLPDDDRELVADLASWRYKLVPGGIAVESKVDLVKRLGRSTDKGDAIVMAWHSGAKAVTDFKNWQEQTRFKRGGAAPKVIMGHQSRRR